MSSWKVILAALVIFVSGITTGALIRRPPERPPTPESAPAPGKFRTDALRKITRELDLTAEQREAVEKTLKESQERTRLLWDQIGPDLREESRLARQNIARILTPEQRKKFEEAMDKRRRRDATRPTAEPRSPAPADPAPANPTTDPKPKPAPPKSP